MNETFLLKVDQLTTLVLLRWKEEFILRRFPFLSWNAAVMIPDVSREIVAFSESASAV